MKTNFAIFIFLFFANTTTFGQSQKVFNSIDEIWDFTEKNNHIFKNSSLQSQLADLSYKTAKINAFNPRIPISVQTIDNTTQQVSFLPGQVFGLPEGTYREVAIGQQYISTFSVQPQFDIINLYNMKTSKIAKVNQELTENQNIIQKLNHFDRLNTVYYGLMALGGQKTILDQNREISINILNITQNKYDEGLIRKQDLNEAQINYLSILDKIDQVNFGTQYQAQNLSLLLEMPIDPKLTENVWDLDSITRTEVIQNQSMATNSKLQRQYYESELAAMKYQNYPVLSFISSFNWQNLSNDFFFSKKSSWIDYNYIGLKLSYDLPTTVNKYTNLKSKQLQYEIQKNNEIFAFKENEIRNNQMVIDLEKAITQKEQQQKIYLLKKDSFEKNYDQYLENVLPLDKLLLSQMDMMNSRLTLITTLANIGLYKHRIELYNRVN
ncbi:MAG: TolC family protein [Saprospiraceae bacterium]|nr:TolC family protein [Saprospiraceae bacterium]